VPILNLTLALNPTLTQLQGFFRQQTPGAGQGDGGGGVDAPAFNDAEFPTLGTGALIGWICEEVCVTESVFLRSCQVADAHQRHHMPAKGSNRSACLE